MIRIAVCDDIPVIVIGVKKILEKHKFSESIEVDVFEDGRSLYESALGKKYDILMMDIELTNKGFFDVPSENGMLLADVIKDRYPTVIVIFFSQWQQYQRDLLQHEPFGFIEKPLEVSRLIEMVEKAIQRLCRREQNEVMYHFKSVQGIVFPIKIQDILYIESQSPRIRVALFSDELVTRKKLDELEEELKEVTSDFVRIHKSYLINLCHIREYTSKTVTMMNGTELPIRRKYLENFIEKISK